MLAVTAAARADAPSYGAEIPVKGALYRDGPTERYLLDGAWLYRADLADVGVEQGLWRDQPGTDGWTPVSVPNAYNASDHSRASMVGWVGWYRKDFLLPAGAFAAATPTSDEHWLVRFESANYRASVWLNGHRLGAHTGGYEPFELELRGLRPGVNRLIVRVDNRRSASDLPPGGFYSGGVTPVGGWWNYGGLLREVYLRAADMVDLRQVQVRPAVACDGCPARIAERVVVANLGATPASVHLVGTYGIERIDFGTATIPAHHSWSASGAIQLAHPRLWSPDHPALYRATLTALGGDGRRLGGYVTYSGIRRITVTRDGRLRLNGRALDLRGVGLHESDLALGAALDPAHLQRLFAWVRDLGATLIRSHYPLNPQIEELADRYGVLLWSEIPVYQVKSEMMESHGWIGFARSMLETNILTNQNHPSVLLWSLGNELASPADAPEQKYIASAASLARSLDPTRPVGMAVSAWPGVGCQHAYAPLQVVGFNDYFGWYDAAIGATADRDQLGPYLDAFRACYPRKAVFVSEFGFEANRQGPVEERGTYAFQDNAALYHLGVFGQKRWLSGAVYWALQDFLCRPGWSGGNPWPDPPFFHKGLVDLDGNLKPAFADVAAAFKATTQIAPPARGP